MMEHKPNPTIRMLQVNHPTLGNNESCVFCEQIYFASAMNPEELSWQINENFESSPSGRMWKGRSDKKMNNSRFPSA